MNELTKKITCTQQSGRMDLTEGHALQGKHHGSSLGFLIISASALWLCGSLSDFH